MSLFGKKRQDEVEAARHMAIKLTLSKEVASSIKKLQRDHISLDSAIRSGDTANRFCNVMEAILLHELKDSYSSKTFWPFLIKFTHRDVIEQIKELSFIKTEVGFCRAWVRLALNDCLMESYISAILRDSKAIRQYYGRNSFFRDPEQPFIINNYLQGLCNFSFQLSHNSTLLNVWGAAPSMLKGSWSPPGDNKANDATAPRPSTDLTASFQDWPAATSPLTSSTASFTIPDGALHVTPTNSLDMPYHVGSFHESEMSTNLLRSLAEDEKGTTRDSVAALSRKIEEQPSVVLEESEDFEDSIVIHMSPTQNTSIQEEDKPPDDAPDTEHSHLQNMNVHSSPSKNPFEDEDAEDAESFNQGHVNDSDAQTKEELSIASGLTKYPGEENRHAPKIPSNQEADDPTSFYSDNISKETNLKMKIERDDFDDNPFFKADVNKDAENPNDGIKKPRIPSLQEELDAAEGGMYVSRSNIEYYKEDDDEDEEGDGDYHGDVRRGKEKEVQSGKVDDMRTCNSRDQGLDERGLLEEDRMGRVSAGENDGGEREEFTSSHGNSLGRNRGWSSEFHRPTSTMSEDTTDGYTRQESYQTLLKNYMDTTDKAITPVSNLSPLTSPTSDTTSKEMSTPPPMKRTQDLLSRVTNIANEKGLDSQNYQCKGCTRPVGIIYGKAKVCGYDGCYYCYECHIDEEAIIPARVLYNWDFRKQKVAKHTKSFLQQIEAMPLIDIAQTNSSLYKAVQELEEVKGVRMQLKYLKAYLFTCKQSVAEELKKRVWPREYMLDHVHLYSMLDFTQVQAGTLSPILRKVVVFAVKHVQQCALCSQKGFICEICENSKIIYPFDTDLTVQCDKCKSVYHRACKTEMKPCPKCVRRKVRKTQADQNASEANFVSPFT
ncbi:pleckstrin homology domain-containing family M member 1 isoform X2 [Strongylocentrotus purpuratus]|uniref:RUN domain-containing protein n=1 Tax=Strongylocentrotus purpuratus TaxID=7668 RepID=A0A7M7NW84_STRPU|nr:pleckstrin homology domain-containing family M member 1 isoform X2 [Strongylocentrotus purpuratus]